MIKKLKSIFTNSIDKNEFEIGAKNSLMQNADNDGKGTWSKHESNRMYSAMTPMNSETKWELHTLDQKIESMQVLIHDYAIGEKQGTQKEIESAKQLYANLLKEKEIETNLQANKEKSNANIEVAKINHNTTIDEAYIDERATIERSKIEKETQISVAKIQQDPNQISQTEMDVFNIVKKYDFLKDPEAFKNLVNTTTDNTVKTDALTLEKDLAKLGMHLKVDGKIDQNTIDAIESLVSKNAPAIKAYKEVTGIDPLKPSETPASSENNIPVKTK